MDTDQYFSEDVPSEAKEWLDAAEREVAALRATTERESEKIREKAEKAVSALEEKTGEAVREIHQGLVQRLKPLQEACLKISFGPLSPEEKSREILRLQDEFRARIQAMYTM